MSGGMVAEIASRFEPHVEQTAKLRRIESRSTAFIDESDEWNARMFQGFQEFLSEPLQFRKRVRDSRSAMRKVVNRYRNLLQPLRLHCAEKKHDRNVGRSEEHTSELQSHVNLVCRLLLEKKK